MGLFGKRASKDGVGFVVSGHRSEWLVGTEHYPNVYTRARAEQRVLVELVAETSNLQDPQAVAGRVEGKVAGYLRREVAAKYHAPLEAASASGFRVFVATAYRPREDGDLGMGWLDIPSPEALGNWLALPDEERARGFDFAAGKSPNTPRAVGRPL
jgi:hypothetical protein